VPAPRIWDDGSLHRMPHTSTVDNTRPKDSVVCTLPAGIGSDATTHDGGHPRGSVPLPSIPFSRLPCSSRWWSTVAPAPSQRDAVRRSVAVVWVQPKGARHSLTPGRCKGKAHRLEHLGMLGTGCWSRASGRTKAWMTTAPNAANLFGNCSSPQASNPPTAPETGPTKGERPGPADPDIPRRPVLLL